MSFNIDPFFTIGAHFNLFRPEYVEKVHQENLLGFLTDPEEQRSFLEEYENEVKPMARVLIDNMKFFAPRDVDFDNEFYQKALSFVALNLATKYHIEHCLINNERLSRLFREKTLMELNEVTEIEEAALQLLQFDFNPVFHPSVARECSPLLGLNANQNTLSCQTSQIEPAHTEQLAQPTIII